jgi:hypothetical protein
MMRMPEVRGTEQIAVSDLVMEQGLLRDKGFVAGKDEWRASKQRKREHDIARKEYLRSTAGIAPDGASIRIRGHRR